MLILFAGDAVNTTRTATIDSKSNKLKVIEWAPGDGKVLSSSARFDQRAGRKWTPFPMSPIKWQIVMYVQGAHMGIMDSDAFLDNLAFYLQSFPSLKRHAAHIYIDKFESMKKKREN